MKKILLYCLLLSCSAQAQRLVYGMQFVTDYTNAQETTLKNSLVSANVPQCSFTLYNTDLAQVRYWNGANFISAPDPGTFMPSNGTSQYLKLTSAGKYPAIDGSLITLLGATNISGNIPFANTAGSSAATSATTGTMTVSMTTPLITITPSGACTFNASGGAIGQCITFVVTTSGVSSFTLTWGTNFKTTATLATGTTTNKKFAVSFLCLDGTTWVETGRTTAM